MASRTTPGAVCCGGDRRVGPIGDGEELSGHRLGWLSSGLLVYGYATGVFSSRKLERATYDSVAFRFIAVNQHPDHDTIATFRRRFLKDIEALFVRVLELAREMGLLKLGTVALDDKKNHANASRHSALSYEHATKIEAQLKAEVAELLARAEAASSARHHLARTYALGRCCHWRHPQSARAGRGNRRSGLCGDCWPPFRQSPLASSPASSAERRR